jgi:hypothetical protein
MMIPNDARADLPWENTAAAPKPMSTLFLLHGYTGKAGNWVPEGLPEKYNFAIVMPTAENSFYLNGEATGTADGAPIRASSTKGSNLFGELGLHLDATDKNPWQADIGLFGTCGKHRGIGGAVSVAYKF